MISLTPTGSPAQTSDAYALIALVTDPAAAKTRLDELAAEKIAATDAAAQATAAATEAKQLRNDAQIKLAEAKRVTIANDAAYAARTKAISDQETSLVEMAKRVDAHDAQVTERENALAAREAAVSAREASVVEQEAAAETTMAEANALKADYEKKLAALKTALE